jgi:hypothetical protein
MADNEQSGVVMVLMDTARVGCKQVAMFFK